MPRVNLGFTPSRQAQVISKIIRKGMVDNDIPDKNTMADRMHMSRQTFSRKLAEGGWKDTELAEAIRILKLCPADALAMVGLKLPKEIA